MKVKQDNWLLKIKKKEKKNFSNWCDTQWFPSRALKRDFLCRFSTFKSFFFSKNKYFQLWEHWLSFFRIYSINICDNHNWRWIKRNEKSFWAELLSSFIVNGKADQIHRFDGIFVSFFRIIFPVTFFIRAQK